MEATLKEIFAQVQGLLTWENGARILQVIPLLIFGWLLARLARSIFRRFIAQHLSEQGAMIGGRLIYYGILGLTLTAALQQFMDLSVLLGAAGILTIALGFASQTSVSNIISGLFLVGERAFKIGDVLQIGTTVGEVTKIDLLSIKLRTFDNQLIRIPNETLLKTEITNKSSFPIRRVDLLIGVAYKEDLGKVRETLKAVAAQQPLCLDEPAPQFQVLSFADSAIQLQFSTWVTQKNFITFRTELHIAIKQALDAASIEIPFPHRSLYAGSATEPFPIRLVDSSQEWNLDENAEKVQAQAAEEKKASS